MFDNIFILFVLFVVLFFRKPLFILFSSPLIWGFVKLKKRKNNIVISVDNKAEHICKHYNFKSFFAMKLSGFLRFYIYINSCLYSHHIRNFIIKYVLGLKMEENVVIYYNVEIREPWKISIGKGTIIGDRNILDGRNGIKIGNYVTFASNVSIWTEQHDHRDPWFRCDTQKKLPVEIGNRAWIGPNTVILHSVHIGEGAVVAAGAVVTKDVEAFSIVAGIPAKKIGERNKNLKYEMDGSYLSFI